MTEYCPYCGSDYFLDSHGSNYICQGCKRSFSEPVDSPEKTNKRR